ncbi:hypothetical protein ACWGBH_20400 [Streptomyces massasporeus]
MKASPRSASNAPACVLDVVRAWRRPAHETADRSLLAGEPAHHRERQACAVLESLLGS